MITLNPARFSRFRSASRERVGFTLVELLAVIAIMAVLASIVIVSIGSIRSAAGTSRCASNLRQLGVVVILYSQDHKGAAVPPNYYNALTTGGYLPVITQSDMQAHAGVWACPSDEAVRSTISATPIDNVSYVVNCQRVGLPPEYWNVSKLTKVSDVENPGRIIYFSDAKSSSGGTKWWITKASANWNIDLRHGGKAHALFFDGHLESILEPVAAADFYNAHL
jgi:prepilin-type N-terminal cleavage/methylation domain-containing protein/prepilin-type processing-associated H-X9-DG protein